MFAFALIIGIYSYLIFFLGIFNVLFREAVVGITIIALVLILLPSVKSGFIIRFPKITFANRRTWVFVILLVLQAFINALGVFGPELSFDALWYHLTLPKMYLAEHSVHFIPGGLLYYSAMPKLGEMLYVAGLSFGNEILVKGIHFAFGIFTTVALYLFARKYFSDFIALIAALIFYSNIVIAWESTVAYIDLIRAFYEVLGLWAFIQWYESKKQTWLYLSAIMIGFAITTKLLAIGSLIIFVLLSIYFTKGIRSKLFNSAKYILLSLLVPLPWFIFSYIHTGNPVYPFFSNVYHVAPEPVSVLGFISEVWKLFTQASDPISPVYAILFPLVFLVFNKLPKQIKIITVYSAFAIIIWYFTPRTGGGRFIIPYLPAFSILCAAVVGYILQNRKTYGTLLPKMLILIILLSAVLTLVYRSVAIGKYLPVLTGQQSKNTFLSNNLNFAFGDFYDTGNILTAKIKSDERVLLYGFHNLYYVNFPFIDSSWIKKGDAFHYIAVQKSELPEKYRDWQLIYSNDKTAVKLYRHKTQYEVIF